MNGRKWCASFLIFALTWLATSHLLGQEANEALQKLFDDYHEQYLILFPLEATAFGDSRFNDQLPIDIGPDHLAKKQRFFQQTLDRLQSIDRAHANAPLQLAADVLDYEMHLRLDAIPLRFERIPFHQFEGLPLAFAQMGSGSGSQPFKTVKDYENWLKRMEQFGTWANVAIDRFREGMRERYVLPKILVERMVRQLLDPSIVCDKPEESLFFGPIRKWPAEVPAADRSRLEQSYAKTIAGTVMPAYRRMGEFLRDEYLSHARDSSGISALPGGREHYQYCVRRWTTTNLSPDEVFAIGKAEVARILDEMDAVRRQMNYDGSLPDFFNHLRDDPQFKPFKSPEEVIEFFAALQLKLEPHLARAFTRRPKTPFQIRRTESFREKTASAEYMPGTADGSRPGIFYVPIPSATQFNITSGMESLFLHEAIPGHHYQISLQQENQDLPQFARFLWYGAYGEGWALYCESLGNELGMYTDPRQRIGALADEMHRAIRLVVDVGMHWKGWTREQAIQYMMEREPISEDGAVAEIERYMAYTAQALSYKIGQLKITEMRKRCEERRGDRFRLAEFHDEVLRHGSLPLSILESRLDRWSNQDAP